MTAGMKSGIAALALVLLGACQSTARLEDDVRYSKLATVVDKHEFSETERQQAAASRPGSGISVGGGFGVGVGSHGRFGGMMIGMGSQDTIADEPPQVAKGAVRYTVQLLGSEERIEVMSYAQHEVGDCVRVLAGHPTEYPRFFELKADDFCN
ncbi:MAG TPA: hypothetical protein VMV48_14300 [Gallionellaceae bacterium]|nr:hypothetical protein [Gallionellaceae bacterium]